MPRERPVSSPLDVGVGVFLAQGGEMVGMASGKKCRRNSVDRLVIS